MVNPFLLSMGQEARRASAGDRYTRQVSDLSNGQNIPFNPESTLAWMRQHGLIQDAEGFPVGMQGTESTAQGIAPQDRVNARAQALSDARLRDRIGTGPRNPWDSFGLGGGDWAGAWQNATRPQTDLRSLLGAQMLAGPNTQNGLAGLFNSASGPYGQLQAAAAFTAPARHDSAARRYEADTQRDVARMKYGTANKIASQLANLIGNGGPMTGLQTDYGMSAQLKPVDLRRFFTRK